MKINFSIRTFLVFLAVSFTVPSVLLFGFFEAFNGVRQAREEAREMNRQAALLIERDIAASLDKFRAFSEGLAVDIDLETLRFKDPEPVKAILKAYPGIAYLLLNEKAVSVAAYASNREIRTGIDYSDREYVKRVLATRQTVISGAIQSRTANTPAVVFSVPLLDRNGELKGLLGGGVPTEEFRSTYHLAPEQFALIADTFGETVSTINTEAKRNLKDDEVYETLVQPIGWKVVVGFPDTYVTGRARQAIYRAVLVALICTLIGAGVASLVAFTTVRGIDKIGRQIQTMSALDLHPIELSSNGLYPREVRTLIGNFNNLLDRTARLRLAEFEAVSHLADTILIVRSDGDVTYANEAGLKLFGNVIGKPLKEIIGNETAVQILTQSQPQGWKGEVAVRKIDGEAFDGFLSSTPVFENDRLSSAVIIVQDITREKAAREAMVQSEKMITLGELVAGTSHELNNPLAIVTGYADLLLHDNVDPEQRIKIESIRKNAHRAANVVHSLLAFARKRKAERVQTDANAVVEAALQLKEYDLRTSGIRLEKDLEKGLRPVYADPNQIQQVLLNLINNAQDAVLAGPNGRKIRIRTQGSGAQVSIRIEDSGHGISKEDLKKVFDPFFTTKPVGKGTGLGLSISYGIVREHGGNIEIQSQVGVGTQVAITLPAYTPLPVQPAQAASTRKPMGSRRFLVVDDEAEIATIIQKILIRSGSTVDTAGGLEEALILATAKEYDFIISDVKMPGGSGIDLYRKLCARAPLYRRRFIFLTGDTSNPSTIQFLEREGVAYFPKPFDFQAMESFLKEAESQATRG